MKRAQLHCADTRAPELQWLNDLVQECCRDMQALASLSSLALAPGGDGPRVAMAADALRIVSTIAGRLADDIGLELHKSAPDGGSSSH